jgi:hypothetical protein
MTPDPLPQGEAGSRRRIEAINDSCATAAVGWSGKLVMAWAQGVAGWRVVLGGGGGFW